MIWTQQIKNGTDVDFDSERIENIVGKGENIGYQSLLLSPQCFKKLYCNGCWKK